MNILDSHVEALAFHYFNFGFLTILNNFWTCLALLTAALSFWKIRSSGSPKHVLTQPDPVADTIPLDSVTAETDLPRESAVGSNDVTDDVDGVRKGKFTMYYEEEDAQCRCGESDGLSTASTEVWEERDGYVTEWWKRWERALEFRNGVNENGWYTCQDLTKLNGNVVRLWDGGLRLTEPWTYSSSGINVW